MKEERKNMQWESPKVYAVKHKKMDIRMDSRSGGVFTALSDEVLRKGGVVYGCVTTDTFMAQHVRAETLEERNRMRGSKYIQSDLRDTFRQVKSDLENGKQVLFSGTSCQTAGLQSFLGRKYEHLLCVDIVCHGVPSPLIWEKYIKWREKKAHGKCVDVDFRNKRDFGWNASVETLRMKKGEKVFAVNSNVFFKLFYNHYILRPSCFQCPYKSTMHPSDITIADYWGIDKAAPGFNDNKGVSLVLINNQLGFDIFSNVMKELTCKECRLEDSLQPPLIKPCEEPTLRTAFWKDVERYSFGKVVSKYYEKGMEYRIRQFVRRGKKKLLGK